MSVARTWRHVRLASVYEIPEACKEDDDAESRDHEIDVVEEIRRALRGKNMSLAVSTQ